jgi:hypothetical protein
VSKRIRTRKHCSLHFGDGKRCRKRGTHKCWHGIHCAEHDQWLHEIKKRHPGDFVCSACDAHFHDEADPAVQRHLEEHAAARRARREGRDKTAAAEQVAAMTVGEALAFMLKRHATQPGQALKIAVMHKIGLCNEHGDFYHINDPSKAPLIDWGFETGKLRK